MHLKVIRRLLQVPREHLVCLESADARILPRRVPTVGIRGELDNITNTNIDDPEEALVLLLEFLLVEYLDSQDAVLVHLAGNYQPRAPPARKRV